MTQDKEFSSLNDEQYLAARSRQARGGDILLAKSWLITSCLIFPNNFQILFEAYMFEKDRQNVEEAAKHLKRLFTYFSTETVLWQEIELIVEHLQTDEESDDSLICRIFEALPQETQRKMLLDVVLNTSDALERPRLSLLAFDKFSDLIPSHGPECLSFLVGKCKKSLVVGSSPDPNQRQHTEDLLQTLVMDICPKLLNETRLKIEVSLLHDILALTIDYVTCIICNKTTSKKSTASNEHDANNGDDQATSSVWKTVLINLEEIGERMGWSLTENISELVSNDPEQIVGRIVSFQQENGGGRNPKQYDSQSQLFYTTTLLFLKGLSEYCQYRPSDDVSKGDWIPSVLVEAFVSHSEETIPLQQMKRRRPAEDERRWPIVTDGHNAVNFKKSSLVTGFLTAVHYFDLIRSDPSSESRFQQLKSMLGESFTNFCVDTSLYQGHFREALHLLRQMATPTNKLSQCRLHVKLASIHFCLGDHQNVAEQIVLAVSCLTIASSSEDEIQIIEEKQVAIPDAQNPAESRIGSVLRQPTVRPRHVHFLAINRQSILSYCTRLLIHILKDRSLQPTVSGTDAAIGHVIVLLQYSYPEEKDLLFVLLHRIRVKESFAYNIFCNYVIHVEFLEEFAYLLSDVSANVALDITPAIASQRRMGTRGANRGEKHDIQKALRKQVSRCYEDFDLIITDFLIKQRGSIIQCLL